MRAYVIICPHMILLNLDVWHRLQQQLLLQPPLPSCCVGKGGCVLRAAAACIEASLDVAKAAGEIQTIQHLYKRTVLRCEFSYVCPKPVLLK